MSDLQYWVDCITEAADECGLEMTNEQANCIGQAVQVSHDNYGMAFYSPPSSDTESAEVRRLKAEIDRLKADHERYERNAENAVKMALGQRSDASVSIGEYGEVTRYGGRTERIQ